MVCTNSAAMSGNWVRVFETGISLIKANFQNNQKVPFHFLHFAAPDSPTLPMTRSPMLNLI